MTSRSFRLETRSRAKDEMKKIITTVEKVRRWEKKWIDLGLSNSLRVHKWVPIRDDKQDEDDENDKENELVEITESQSIDVQDASLLPEISQVGQRSMMTDISMETTGLLTDQAPPDILMMSDDADRKAQVGNVAIPPATTEGVGVLPNPPVAEQTTGSTSASAELVAGGGGGSGGGDGREGPGDEKMAVGAELRVAIAPEGVYLTREEEPVNPDMVHDLEKREERLKERRAVTSPCTSSPATESSRSKSRSRSPH